MSEAVPFHEKLHTLTIEEFGELYLSIIAAISKHGGKAIIFDGDKPVAQLTQYEEPPLNGYGSMKGQIKIHGDIVSPLPPEWYTSCTGHDEDLPT
jgi:hypothetical protein